MKIRASINFWTEGVGCFCHEAVARALKKTFGDVDFDKTDIAYLKYLRASSEPLLQESAWFEFLRNGPRHSFKLKSGVTGVFGRYEIVFELPSTVSEDEIAKIRQFLQGLTMRPIEVDQTANEH